MDENVKPESQADKLALAYAMVFGRDDAHRTEQQQLVMHDMWHRGYLRRSTAVAMADGKVCLVKMEIAEGMRIFHLDTLNYLDRAKRLGTAKTKTKATLK